MYPIIISIEPRDFKNVKIIESVPDRLELYEKHLEAKFRMKTETKDEDTGQPKQEFCCGNWTILKSSIVLIDCGYEQSKEIYCLSLFSAVREFPLFHFETMKDALAVKDKILNWLLK